MKFKPLFLSISSSITFSYCLSLPVSHTHTHIHAAVWPSLHHIERDWEFTPSQTSHLYHGACLEGSKEERITSVPVFPVHSLHIHLLTHTHTAFGLHTLEFSQPVGAGHLRLSYFSCETDFLRTHSWSEKTRRPEAATCLPGGTRDTLLMSQVKLNSLPAFLWGLWLIIGEAFQFLNLPTCHKNPIISTPLTGA